jgi:hypothetical protein
MKVSIAFIGLLAAFAIASTAPVDKLDARIDCSTCHCSSVESCTVSPALRLDSMLKGVCENSYYSFM